MCRLFAPTLRREPLRNHLNDSRVPIPPTPCQMERIRTAVLKDYAKKPALGRKVVDAITLYVFGGQSDYWALHAVAQRYCREHLNGF